MNKLLMVLWMLLPMVVVAQEPAENSTLDAGVASENTTTQKTAVIGEASINLRTTVTGNQEQPRVMYILPWQSPLSPELEMEMLGSEADSVFGHVERDELQRQLEAAGELDAAQ